MLFAQEAWGVTGAIVKKMDRASLNCAASFSTHPVRSGDKYSVSVVPWDDLPMWRGVTFVLCDAGTWTVEPSFKFFSSPELAT